LLSVFPISLIKILTVFINNYKGFSSSSKNETNNSNNNNNNNNNNSNNNNNNNNKNNKTGIDTGEPSRKRRIIKIWCVKWTNGERATENNIKPDLDVSKFKFLVGAIKKKINKGKKMFDTTLQNKATACYLQEESSLSLAKTKKSFFWLGTLKKKL
jgi:hypothetical protein